MISGIGIDAVSIGRIRKLFENRGDRFLERFFSSSEIKYCMAKKDPVPSIAANFAAKEAFLKSIGKGIGQGVSLKSISVERDGRGRPRINIINNEAGPLMEAKIHVSISHEGDTAIAIVVVES